MNRKTCLVFAAIFLGLLSVNVAIAQVNQGQSYKMPPTYSGKFGHIISDEDMKKCVELYNQVEWMSEDLERMHVNVYSEESVNAYNEKAKQVNELVSKFNMHCADRSSESACAEANKLNRENNLPEIDCTVR